MGSRVRIRPFRPINLKDLAPREGRFSCPAIPVAQSHRSAAAPFLPATIFVEVPLTELIERNRTALADLCRRFGVERLYVFGSAASGNLGPGSDVDLVVSMTDRAPTSAYADRFLDFAEAVEVLLGRRVDLVSEHAIRNPFFRREVEATRQLVYGRSVEEASV